LTILLLATVKEAASFDKQVNIRSPFLRLDIANSERKQNNLKLSGQCGDDVTRFFSLAARRPKKLKELKLKLCFAI
jgi:hypothetical protein